MQNIPSISVVINETQHIILKKVLKSMKPNRLLIINMIYETI